MDTVYESFLATQLAEAEALAAASDLLDVVPVDGSPPCRYIARFHARGLVQQEDGTVAEADTFDVGIWFPQDYLRRAAAEEVLTYLGPHRRPWHPNIRPPFLCVRLRPGTPLVDLLYLCFELWTWTLYSTRDDGLNRAASQWARQQDAGRCFPVDRRPLKRRHLSFPVNTSCGVSEQ